MSSIFDVADAPAIITVDPSGTLVTITAQAVYDIHTKNLTSYPVANATLGSPDGNHVQVYAVTVTS